MKKIFFGFNKLDNDTYKIMKYGLLFATVICILAVSVLGIYLFKSSISLYYLGLLMLKTGFAIAVEFIICGTVVDFIRKYDLN